MSEFVIDNWASTATQTFNTTINWTTTGSTGDTYILPRAYDTIVVRLPGGGRVHLNVTDALRDDPVRFHETVMLECIRGMRELRPDHMPPRMHEWDLRLTAVERETDDRCYVTFDLIPGGGIPGVRDEVPWPETR